MLVKGNLVSLRKRCINLVILETTCLYEESVGLESKALVSARAS